MHRIKLLKAGDAWNVLADRHLSSCADLELAVLKALELSELHGWLVELGPDVPPDALDRVKRRRQLDGSRSGRVSEPPSAR